MKSLTVKKLIELLTAYSLEYGDYTIECAPGYEECDYWGSPNENEVVIDHEGECVIINKRPENT